MAHSMGYTVYYVHDLHFFHSVPRTEHKYSIHVPAPFALAPEIESFSCGN